MKTSRFASGLLVILAVGIVVVIATFVATSVPRNESGYGWIFWAFLAAGLFVMLCVLAAVVLTIALMSLGHALLTSSLVPRLLNALAVILGALATAMLAVAVFMLWGFGFKTASSLLLIVWPGVGGLVSAAMMMIAVSFRSVLERYRATDAELAVVI